MTQPDFYVRPATGSSAKTDKMLWVAAVVILGVVFMPALIAWSFGFFR
jgi:hypothetical protein